MSSLNEVMNNANSAQIAWRESEQRLENARTQFYAELEVSYNKLKAHAQAQSVVILTTIKQAQLVEAPKESSSSSSCIDPPRAGPAVIPSAK